MYAEVYFFFTRACVCVRVRVMWQLAACVGVMLLSHSESDQMAKAN